MKYDPNLERLLSRQDILWRSLRLCCLLFIAALLIQSLGRLLLYLLFTAPELRAQYSADVGKVFARGLRFDMQVAAYLSALPLLLCLLSLVHRCAASLIYRLQPYLLCALLALLLAATVADIFYFQVYERQFDVFVFGLFEEDTRAVLDTIWKEYPVIRAGLGLLVLLWLLYRGISAAARRPLRRPRTALLPAAVLLAIALLALAMRGSLGTFPLRQAAAQVSAAPQLNRLVANAVLSLDWARKEHRNSRDFRPVSAAEGLNLISTVSGQPASGTDLQQFYRMTPANPAAAAQPPNVVLAVMESMSGHLLQLHDGQRDLLGRLAGHWQSDWLYPRFVSEGDGTSDSLHRFFVRSPNLSLSQSSAKEKTFISNMFTPYLEADYRVVYITSGNGAWRDFDRFLSHLGVHEVADENTLKARYPEAESGTWGVADEWMFRYAEETLRAAQAEGRPVFIMMMSVTNHPPYRLPPGQSPQRFALRTAERQRLAQLGEGGALDEILNTFRYANDQLGAFIDTVKAELPRTIIAATGDHNMRAIGYPDTAEAALGHAVPFYLYVPQAYRAQALYRRERVASHKDILPTLYALSLSQARYYQTGCNLLAADEADSPWCGYGYNREILLLPEGYYHLESQRYYPWQDAERLIAAREAAAAPEHYAELLRRARAYGAFLQWQLGAMVSGVQE